MLEESQLSDSQEDYLETIFHLVKENSVARVKDIAQRMNVNMSSVTGALKNLTVLKMIEYEPYHYVTLTSKGKAEAKRIVRKHDVLSTLLTRVLSISPEEAEHNACRMEHAIDKHVLDRLVVFIQFVEQCPHHQKEWLEAFEKRVKEDRIRVT